MITKYFLKLLKLVTLSTDPSPLIYYKAHFLKLFNGAANRRISDDVKHTSRSKLLAARKYWSGKVKLCIYIHRKILMLLAKHRIASSNILWLTVESRKYLLFNHLSRLYFYNNSYISFFTRSPHVFDCHFFGHFGLLFIYKKT